MKQDDRTEDRKAKDDAVRHEVEAKGPVLGRSPPEVRRAIVALARNAKRTKGAKTAAQPGVGGPKVVRTFRLPTPVRQAMKARSAQDGFSHLVDLVQVLMVSFVRGDVKAEAFREFSIVDPRQALRGTGGMPTWIVKVDQALYARFRVASFAAGLVPADCLRALATAYAVQKVSVRAS